MLLIFQLKPLGDSEFMVRYTHCLAGDCAVYCRKSNVLHIDNLSGHQHKIFKQKML